MFVKSALLFLALGTIHASFYDLSDTCVQPRIAHGRVRIRQRSKLARFTCMPRYELVGNKYATCRNGQWDVPLPICVRASCQIPKLANGLSMFSHGGAWVIFFCFPNHELVGSPAIYCDGYQWNATVPTCVDTTLAPKLSCDFEDTDLCGWKQDALHDFDWLRLNQKTPSSFLFTGPSYDHTLGMGKDGHYMYIESTSQVQNDTARLISPVYDSSLSQQGCFAFSYHMYGKTCGGLRVYQIPENITVKAIVDLPEEEKRAYLLFEKWGNLGDIWFNAVSPLKNLSVDFQIIVEGIRGSSYTSDIAIDDVAILQGEKCTAAAIQATTPLPQTTTVSPDSCVNRCSDELFSKPKNDTGCSCSYACLLEETCCLDFYGVCVFNYDSTVSDSNDSVTVKSASEEAPQTLKLVAVTTVSTTTSITTPSTHSTTTTNRPTTNPPPTTTQRRTTEKPTPTDVVILRYKTPVTVKYTSPSTTTATPSTTTSTTTTRKPTTTNRPTTAFKPTTSKSIGSTTKLSTVSKQVKPLSTTAATTKKVITTKGYKIDKPIENDNYLEKVEAAKQAEELENGEVGYEDKTVIRAEVKVLSQTRGRSTSVKIITVILVLASLIAVAMAVHVGFRSTRVRIALARIRGQRNRDPEVRYLSSDVDDD